VRTIVTVATPHRGTPLASSFTTRFGGQLLGVLSLGTLYVLNFGRLPLSVTLADQLCDQLLGDFSPERRNAFERLWRDVTNFIVRSQAWTSRVGHIEQLEQSGLRLHTRV
jgi:triacylglycerol lipase